MATCSHQMRNSAILPSWQIIYSKRLDSHVVEDQRPDRGSSLRGPSEEMTSMERYWPAVQMLRRFIQKSMKALDRFSAKMLSLEDAHGRHVPTPPLSYPFPTDVDDRKGDHAGTYEGRYEMDGSNGAPIEDDCATIPDEKLVLKPENISCAKRCDGTWMFKVKYEDSTLAREFFGQLLFSDAVLSRLAREAQFEGAHCRVQWWPEWVPIWGMVLTNPYAELVRRLDTLTSTHDEVRWEANTVSGSGWSRHLCLSGHCRTCRE